ncbi:hypothetical protein NC651_001687 [Populus alba x Populus x berolinensis]|nr:hypothetical protein NC651_001687 [Populus alba x Populus x berolinensis]
MRGYINKIKVVQRSARNAFSSGNQIISVFHSEKKINQRRRGPKSRFLSHRCLKSLAEPKTIQTVRNGMNKGFVFAVVLKARGWISNRVVGSQWIASSARVRFIPSGGKLLMEECTLNMVMNANVVKRDMLKVMQDSVSISQYLCIVALVGLVWAHTLQSTLDENSLLLLDASLFGSGSTIKAPVALKNPSLTSCVSLNASVVASVFVASRLPSRLHEYKFEINGPWDEAKLCFNSSLVQGARKCSASQITQPTLSVLPASLMD